MPRQPMPPETNPTLPSGISIPIPRQYRDYLIHKQNVRYLVASTLVIGVLSFFYFVVHGKYIDYGGIGIFVFSLIAWLQQIRKPWNYIIDAKHATVIWWEMGGRIWRSFDVLWQRDAILGVEELEWRGLPMLRLRRASKNPKWEPYWVMVYAHEDAEKVRTQVIPLIEKYRHQHRQSNMADRLRS